MPEDRLNVSRRTWLRGCGLVGASWLAGCGAEESSSPTVIKTTTGTGLEERAETPTGTATETPTDEQTPQPTDTWYQFRGDPQHRGVAPAGAGPAALEQAWRWDFQSVVDSDARVGKRSVTSPILAEESVIVGLGYRTFDDERWNTKIVGLDSTTGELNWVTDLGQHSWLGPMYDPVTDGTSVFQVLPASADEDVAVVEAATGEVTDGVKIGQGRLTRITTDGNRLYAGGTVLASISPEDGMVEWTQPIDPNVREFEGLPLTAGTLYRAAESTFYGYDLSTGDSTFEKSYSIPDQVQGGSVRFGAPTLVDGVAYAAGGVSSVPGLAEAALVVFDTETGEERWQFKPATVNVTATVDATRTSAVYGYPLVHGDLVIVSAAEFLRGDGVGIIDSRAYVVGLDIEDGTQRWEVKSPLIIHPVAAGDTIYLIGTGSVRTVSIEGSVLEELPPSEVNSRRRGFTASHPPAVGYGHLYVSTDGGVVAFGDP
jgi:outer membrane protein assembly factor BamB